MTLLASFRSPMKGGLTNRRVEEDKNQNSDSGRCRVLDSKPGWSYCPHTVDDTRADGASQENDTATEERCDYGDGYGVLVCQHMSVDSSAPVLKGSANRPGIQFRQRWNHITYYRNMEVLVKRSINQSSEGGYMFSCIPINPQQVLLRITFCTVRFSVIPTRFKIFFTGMY